MEFRPGAKSRAGSQTLEGNSAIICRTERERKGAYTHSLFYKGHRIYARLLNFPLWFFIVWQMPSISFTLRLSPIKHAVSVVLNHTHIFRGSSIHLFPSPQPPSFHSYLKRLPIQIDQLHFEADVAKRYSKQSSVSGFASSPASCTFLLPLRVTSAISNFVPLLKWNAMTAMIR